MTNCIFRKLMVVINRKLWSVDYDQSCLYTNEKIVLLWVNKEEPEK